MNTIVTPGNASGRGKQAQGVKSPRRKWPWVILFVVAVVMPSCVAAIMGAMKQSEAYAMSLAAIQQHEAARAVLGERIEAGFFVTGNVRIEGPDGRAALQYAVKGNKAEGNAFAYATKRAGQWQLDQVVVDVPSGKKRIKVVGAE